MEPDKILQWIDEYQKGKSGIYPHHVALEVCATFGVPVSAARKLVLQHIKAEIGKLGELG